jgi:hypothetical protein
MQPRGTRLGARVPAAHGFVQRTSLLFEMLEVRFRGQRARRSLDFGHDELLRKTPDVRIRRLKDVRPYGLSS